MLQRSLFVTAGLVVVIALAALALGQEKSKKDRSQASLSTEKLLGVEPVTVKDAVWSARTNPKKPNIVTVAVDLRKLSVLQQIDNLQLTVKLINKRTKAVEVETFRIPSLAGGKVYTQDFTAKLKTEDWGSIAASAGKLEGALRSRFYVNQPPPLKPIA